MNIKSKHLRTLINGANNVDLGLNRKTAIDTEGERERERRMVKLFGMCFNWKVLLALGAVGVGIWAVAPSTLLKALPFLLLAACPLSMLVMAWGMKRMMGGTHQASPACHVESPQPVQLDPRERLADLEAKQAALQREIGQVRSEIDQPEQTNRAAVRAKGHDAG